MKLNSALVMGQRDILINLKKKMKKKTPKYQVYLSAGKRGREKLVLCCGVFSALGTNSNQNCIARNDIKLIIRSNNLFFLIISV